MLTNNKKINFTKAVLNELPLPKKGKRAYYYDIKTRGLGISVTSAGTKSFVVYRWVNGKPERVTVGRYPDLSIEQARGKAAEVNASIAQGENPNDKRRSKRAELTFEDLFNEYIVRHAKLHKKTWEEDEERYRLHLSHWKQRKLSTIQKNDIQKLHQKLGYTNGIYAANRLLSLLSILFNKAIEFGVWDKINPTHGIKKFREVSRDRFLQPSELPHFFKALAEEPNDLIRDYILLSLLTGARKGNVVSMRWDDVRFETSEWYIPETKNGLPHTVTLTQEAMTILIQRKKQQIEKTPFVFPSTGVKGHLVEPKKGWKRMLERANIKNLRLHDLRRTLGSWQAREGTSLAIIGKSLNHKSLASTAIYARLDLDPVRSSVEKAVDAMFKAGQVQSIKKIVATDQEPVVS